MSSMAVVEGGKGELSSCVGELRLGCISILDPHEKE